MTFPRDTRGRTSPHDDPLHSPSFDPQAIPAVSKGRGDILWEMGPTFVESFIDPESLYFYIRQRHNDTYMVMNIADLAAIVKAVVDRALKAKFSDAPTGDDLPF